MCVFCTGREQPSLAQLPAISQQGTSCNHGLVQTDDATAIPWHRLVAERACYTRSCTARTWWTRAAANGQRCCSRLADWHQVAHGPTGPRLKAAGTAAAAVLKSVAIRIDADGFRRTGAKYAVHAGSIPADQMMCAALHHR